MNILVFSLRKLSINVTLLLINNAVGVVMMAANNNMPEP